MFRSVVPILAATLLVACGGGSDSATLTTTPVAAVPGQAGTTTDAPTDSPTSTATGTAGPDTADAPVVPAALQLTAPLVGGGEIELGALAGRPVLLWFWAPW